MRNEFKIVAATGVAIMLAGCGTAPLTQYQETDQAMAAMAANYLDANGNPLGGDGDITLWADVPTVGGATYNGFVGGDLIGGDLAGRTIVGELSLEANFVSNDFIGSADNFYDDTDVQYTGTLSVTSSQILRGGTIGTNDQITVALDGVLNDGLVDYGTSVGLSGNFIGATPAAVGGFADGWVGNSDLLGIFIAEQ